jgi:DNA-binding IclR family transcriptional regulator
VSAAAAPVFVGGEAVAALGVSGPDLVIETVGTQTVALAGELTDAMAGDDG